MTTNAHGQDNVNIPVYGEAVWAFRCKNDQQGIEITVLIKTKFKNDARRAEPYIIPKGFRCVEVRQYEQEKQVAELEKNIKGLKSFVQTLEENLRGYKEFCRPDGEFVDVAEDWKRMNEEMNRAVGTINHLTSQLETYKRTEKDLLGLLKKYDDERKPWWQRLFKK